MSTAWRRKNNRLSVEAGGNAYLVTVATEGRARRFADGGLVAMCTKGPETSADAEGIAVLAYVFMPDRLHMPLLGAETASLPRFVKRFKPETAFSFKRSTGQGIWQKSYDDHILRREEDLTDVAHYVAANPARAGLVTGWAEYPFTGGTLLDGARDGDLKVAATSRGATLRGTTSQMLDSGMAPL